MLVFWIAAALLSAAAVAVVMARAGRADPEAADSPELIVYRRHLSELDELRARGLLDDEGHAAARAEAARRLLSIKPQVEAAPKPRDPRRDRTLVLGAAALAVTLGAGVYLLVGSPGLGDQPYRSRLKSWLAADPATLGPGEMAAILKGIAVKKPRDPQVWRFLAQSYDQAGDAAGAVDAYEKAINLDPSHAADWAGLGKNLVALNDGQIGPDAQRALGEALKRDPTAPGPRYLMGQAAIESGRKADGIAAWRSLAETWPKDDPRRVGLEARIASVEGAAPSDAAQAVAQAAPDQQTQMIRGMVAGLAAKLADHPDDPDGWARLVRSYGVLGDAQAKAAALTRARGLFKDRPADLAKIEAAAK